MFTYVYVLICLFIHNLQGDVLAIGDAGRQVEVYERGNIIINLCLVIDMHVYVRISIHLYMYMYVCVYIYTYIFI
jgi:hypothetical protein